MTTIRPFFALRLLQRKKSSVNEMNKSEERDVDEQKRPSLLNEIESDTGSEVASRGKAGIVMRTTRKTGIAGMAGRLTERRRKKIGRGRVGVGKNPLMMTTMKRIGKDDAVTATATAATETAIGRTSVVGSVDTGLDIVQRTGMTAGIRLGVVTNAGDGTARVGAGAGVVLRILIHPRERRTALGAAKSIHLQSTNLIVLEAGHGHALASPKRSMNPDIHLGGPGIVLLAGQTGSVHVLLDATLLDLRHRLKRTLLQTRNSPNPSQVATLLTVRPDAEITVAITLQ
jgi:hypothetical protein